MNNKLTTVTAAAASTAPSAPKSTTKVEVFADPGVFNGEVKQFKEWWLKIRTWLNINANTITPAFYKATAAVLSHMKQKAGTFAAQWLELRPTYTWAELENEIVKQYCPVAKPNWARKQLWAFKQENTHSCDSVDRFKKHYRDSKIGASHAIDILEKNMNLEICDQIVREEKRLSMDIEAYLEVVQTTGETMETMNFLHKGQSGFFSLSSSSHFQSSQCA